MFKIHYLFPNIEYRIHIRIVKCPVQVYECIRIFCISNQLDTRECVVDIVPQAIQSSRVPEHTQRRDYLKFDIQLVWM